MCCAISSIKFVKSPREKIFVFFLAIIFLLLPIKNLAKADCSNLIRFEQVTALNEKYLQLDCTDRNWREKDLIRIKSKSGEVVGLLQLEKRNSLSPESSTEGNPGLLKDEILPGKNETADGSREGGKLDGSREGVAQGDGKTGKLGVGGESAVISNGQFSERITKAVNSRKGYYRNRRLKKIEDVKRRLEPTETTSLLKLISVREDRLLQKTDYFEKLDLVNSKTKLPGTSYLWKTHVLPADTQNLYRPLLTQGETIGETAQTLWKNEYYFTVFGTIGYGVTDTLSASTNLTALVLGSPNAKLKNQVYRNVNQTWSVSLSMAQERNSSEKLFNVDVMWDSILTDTLVAHSLISAAVISFDSAKEVAALKSYGSSSIQTGYEYIFTNWSRFLIGPSYNIDQKAIGGYLGYVKIINNLHLQASLTTNNIRELKLSAKEGYFFILDAYWRW